MIHVSEQGSRPAISWGAIIAGVFLSLLTYVAFSLLGTAITASTIHPLQQTNPFSGLGWGAAFWVAIGLLVSIGVGSYAAGWCGGRQGMLHGLLAWTVATIVGMSAVVSVASSVAGAGAGMIGKGLSLAGEGVGAVVPGIAAQVRDQARENGIELDVGHLKSQFDKLLQQTGKSELSPQHLAGVAEDAVQGAKAATQAPGDAGDALTKWFDGVKAAAEPTLSAANKDALVNIIVANTGKSRAEATRLADDYAQTYANASNKFDDLRGAAEQRAREVGDAAASAVSRGAWIALLVLVLGGVVGAVAGHYGARRASMSCCVA